MINEELSVSDVILLRENGYTVLVPPKSFQRGMSVIYSNEYIEVDLPNKVVGDIIQGLKYRTSEIERNKNIGREEVG